MSLVQVTVLNWDKYNPRTDRKNHSWFRFQNNFFTDPKLYGLTDSQIILLQMCWCEASESGATKFIMNMDFLATVRKTQLLNIEADFTALRKRGLIIFEIEEEGGFIPPADYHVPPDGGEQPPLDGMKTAYERTDERTDITNVTDGEEYISGDPLTPRLPRLAEIWNRVGEDVLPPVRKSNAQRDRQAKARWRDHSASEWEQIVQRIRDSDFCVGGNDRGWKATFDWLLQPATSLKVLEGKYDNRANLVGGGTSADYFRKLEQEEQRG